MFVETRRITIGDLNELMGVEGTDFKGLMTLAKVSVELGIGELEAPPGFCKSCRN